MKEQIEKMEQEKKLLQERINKLQTAIRALQEVCDHAETEYTGNDSHYTYEKCKACGITIKA